MKYISEKEFKNFKGLEGQGATSNVRFVKWI
jgi:hypothetical protein